ncbi:MAG: transcriptional repressor LexA [Planctomycetes bacterium]|nr:transcriptional repressor LexA [Planctomycetota bacterium]MBU4399174.1 transcriptional repressor LexA [Planctomycetota bacterium]MCG2683179.1 transcriptional repressor LexA [Planctomycetales bacterium]
MDDSHKRRGRRPTTDPTDPQRRVLREIRDFLVHHGFPPTTKEIADAIDISTATAHEQVGQLVRKGYIHREPRKARGLTILREPAEEPVDIVAVELYGMVAAGPLSLAEENILGEVMVDRGLVRSGPHFALRVTGDSMQGAAIRDGDIVIVRQQPIAQNGDIVVAQIGNDATLKRLSIREHEIELRPENPNFQPISIGPDDDLRILGKVVAVRRSGDLPNT